MESNSFENFNLSSPIENGSPSNNYNGDVPTVQVNRNYNKNNKDRGAKPKPLSRSDPPTVIDLHDSVKIDPAVGWLVCIAGVDKGQSFRLVKGNNAIGRNSQSKSYAIALKDQSISRKGACGVIVYNQKANQFFITPGDLTANINLYLNDEILLSPKLLENKAKIEIAGDVLVFVPFCSDKFKWNFEDSKPPIPAETPGSIVRCPNGHFYDTRISKTCPYCEVLTEQNDPEGNTRII